MEKNGKNLVIDFITASSDHRHLNIYVEDLKKVGIVPNVEQLSWSSISKRLDQHDFDMYWLAWGASRLRDPEASWHSKTADEPATNNITGVKDPIIDSLIEAQRTLNDLDARNDILRQIDNRLNEIVPYVLLWQSDHHRALYWRKFGNPETVYDKFNREDAIPVYWWHSSFKKDQLSEARKTKESIPKPPSEVYWEQ